MTARVVAVADSGLIVLEEERAGRVWRTEVPPDGRVTMAEAAFLCGVSRQTVYRWAESPTGGSYWNKGPILHVAGGAVTLPELRRYLKARGRYWLDRHPGARLVAENGPVDEAPAT